MAKFGAYCSVISALRLKKIAIWSNYTYLINGGHIYNGHQRNGQSLCDNGTWTPVGHSHYEECILEY